METSELEAWGRGKPCFLEIANEAQTSGLGLGIWATWTFFLSLHSFREIGHLGFQNDLSGSPLPLSFDSLVHLPFLLMDHMVSSVGETHPVPVTWTHIPLKLFLKKMTQYGVAVKDIVSGAHLPLRLCHFLAVYHLGLITLICRGGI